MIFEVKYTVTNREGYYDIFDQTIYVEADDVLDACTRVAQISDHDRPPGKFTFSNCVMVCEQFVPKGEFYYPEKP